MKLIEAMSLLGPRPDRQPYPVSLLCGFTAQPLQTFLGAHLQLRAPERRVEVTADRFDDLLGNLRRYQSGGGTSAAMVMEWPDLDSRLGWRQHGGWGRARNADIASTVEQRLNLLLEQIRSAPAPLVIALPSVDPAPTEPTSGAQLGRLQAKLQSALAGFAASLVELAWVRVVNPGKLASVSPADHRFDGKALLQTGFPYSLSHADALAALLAGLIQPTPPLKGIITDLDNTLWSGVLGEIGVDGVSWDQEHHSAAHGAYQQMLQSLGESGALLAIASKNDRALVEAAFTRSDILLRRSSVFPVEAHWRPKSESVSRILTAWNIAADSVLFIDDSPMELAEVQAAHPRIQVRQFFPEQRDRVLALVRELPDLFGKHTDSAEDGIRLQSLRAGAEIGAAAADGASMESVLETAHGKIVISPVGDPPDSRALELINKTNQFNLNGRRIAEADWLSYLKRPGHLAWVVSYEDRFGPLGKICVLAGHGADSGEFQVDHWVLSCRAFSRRIEYAVLEALYARLGVRSVRFQFTATERNGPTQEMLAQLTGKPAGEQLALEADEFADRRLPCYCDVGYSEVASAP